MRGHWTSGGRGRRARALCGHLDAPARVVPACAATGVAIAHDPLRVDESDYEAGRVLDTAHWFADALHGSLVVVHAIQGSDRDATSWWARFALGCPTTSMTCGSSVVAGQRDSWRSGRGGCWRDDGADPFRAAAHILNAPATSLLRPVSDRALAIASASAPAPWRTSAMATFRSSAAGLISAAADDRVGRGRGPARGEEQGHSHRQVASLCRCKFVRGLGSRTEFRVAGVLVVSSLSGA